VVKHLKNTKLIQGVSSVVTSAAKSAANSASFLFIGQEKTPKNLNKKKTQ
jgi:cyclic lactone autoinducer peptide